VKVTFFFVNRGPSRKERSLIDKDGAGGGMPGGGMPDMGGMM